MEFGWGLVGTVLGAENLLYYAFYGEGLAGVVGVGEDAEGLAEGTRSTVLAIEANLDFPTLSRLHFLVGIFRRRASAVGKYPYYLERGIAGVAKPHRGLHD